ncbi:MAG: DUF3786 domain-containing protein [Candidatus Abyssubacteria bacterium]
MCETKEERATEVKRTPENKYEPAREIAWSKLEKRDLSKTASDGLLQLDSAGRIVVPFLADRYLVDVGARKVLFESGAELYPFLTVLILHYLVGVDERPLTGEWISFREFEGGDVYIAAFTNRTLNPLKKAFGDRPELLVPASEPLGAERIEFGDVGLRVPVFPKVPLAVIVWRGDEEFPPEANVLFDKTAKSILDTEDLAICGALTVSKLRKNAEKLQKDAG